MSKDFKSFFLKKIIFDQWGTKLGLLILALVNVTTGLSVSWWQKKIFQTPFDQMDKVISILAILILVYFLTYQWLFFQSQIVSLKTQKKLSYQLYDRLLNYRFQDWDQKAYGQIITVFTQDIPSSGILTEQSLPQFLNIVFSFLFGTVALIHWFQANVFVTLTYELLFFVTLGYLAFRQSRFFKNYKNLASVRVGYINALIQNIREIRLTHLLPYFEQKIHQARIKETKNRIEMLNNGQTMNTVSSSIPFLMAVHLVVIHPELKPEIFSGIFWICSVFLVRAFRQWPWFLTFVFDALSSAQRIWEVLHNPKQKDLNYLDASNLSDFERSYVQLVDAIQNSDDPSECLQKWLNQNRHRLFPLQIEADWPINRQAPKRVSFELNPGEILAIIGSVGSGKTLFFLGLLGEVSLKITKFRMGDLDLKRIPPRYWGYLFGYVPEKGFIINSTLRDNVVFRYDCYSSQDEEILFSLTHAAIDLSKEGFTEGLATLVGERGLNLSGGQKQRVSLARSFCWNRPVWLWDNVLSALDNQTAQQVLKFLKAYLERVAPAVILTFQDESHLNTLNHMGISYKALTVDQLKPDEALHVQIRLDQ